MDDQVRLREILERSARTVRSEPSLARHTGRTTVRPGTIDSPEPREAALRMLDTTDNFSPYRDVFSRANDVQRLVRFVGRGD
jgi:hypothetical protein